MVHVRYADGRIVPFPEQDAWENESEGDLVLFTGGKPVRAIARGVWQEVWTDGPDQDPVE